jgi:ubiquitin-like-conjugating enzyme ATG10
VRYDILLSKSYGVPVLYFSVHSAGNGTIRDVDKVNELIVPRYYREQVQDVGVVGGISMAVCALL